MLALPTQVPEPSLVLISRQTGNLGTGTRAPG